MKKTRFLIIIAFVIAMILVVSEIRDKMSGSRNTGQEEDAATIRGITYFVAPSGNDENDGRSEQSAFLTLQKAVDTLMPGDGAILSDGIYSQDFVTVREGTRDRPIIVKGSEKAIVKGSGELDKVVEIRHSHIVLSGFTIDGLGGGDGSDAKHYRDKLIYVEGSRPMIGVTGLKIIGMHLTNAGGECLRIKYFSERNEVAHNTITRCGAYDFIFRSGGKNGEGIYIGTAPEQIAKGKNLTRDVDASDNNWIHDNDIDTQGNECVDIKEGSSGNVVERNACTGQLDPDSAGLDSRGSGNIFRDNEVFGNAGAGIRLGGDTDDDGIQNIVTDNHLHDNMNGGIKVQSKPQSVICGNRIENNEKGDMVGEYGDDTKNKTECG